MNARIHALRSMLESGKVDAALITSGANLRYLTGFTGSNGTLLLTDKKAFFYTDPRYTEQAAAETGMPVKTVRGPLLKAASKDLQRIKPKRLGFEDQRLSVAQMSALQAELPLGCQLAGLAEAVDHLRMIKSEDEIAAIRASVFTCSRAFEAALKVVKPTLTEAALANELDYQMRRFGAEGSSFETIVAAGPRTALPHARPTRDRLGHQLVLIDMGASQEGYASDMTRMLHLGAPGKQALRMHRAVLEAQLAAIDAVAPGATAARVDRAARQVLKKHGMDKEFVHSTGHGLGLEIHEAPRLGKSDRTVLKPGMVITIEPGVYFEGTGGVRIEDTVLVTEKGCEILTPTSKELRVLE